MTADVSIILPVHNAGAWLDECLQSVLDQQFTGGLELSVFLDACTDKSSEIIESWKPRLEAAGMAVVIDGHNDKLPKGIGYAKNRAILQSHGAFLCFLDADDVMDCHRIEMQLAATADRPFTIYTAHGPTVIMPTWFCSRETFNRVGAFDEIGKGMPEDLLFFLDHLRLGGKVIRVDQCLLMYRYHLTSATHSVSQETMWDIRMKALEERVLSQWDSFTIWNAGKQGRRFYRSLGEQNQKKVSW
ncbi:UDP-GlcNAc:betaGal beta-1,3-N-acetylglucosaminyltransferase-like protein 1 isoform X2 [Patiria miniata]|uniref:Glycosyltransferase 2-like domain-containing protein n=1 Tax=Patiria miniata TaxID=46514 RepID=A0A914ARQ8_PATMI|nr:UDP-GlcNAc:betaGal beta-1,3-N-acetylglucosaminyltransferase-like protein 1 isoform X2 [Patiria miniata]